MTQQPQHIICVRVGEYNLTSLSWFLLMPLNMKSTASHNHIVIEPSLHNKLTMLISSGERSKNFPPPKCLQAFWKCENNSILCSHNWSTIFSALPDIQIYSASRTLVRKGGMNDMIATKDRSSVLLFGNFFLLSLSYLCIYFSKHLKGPGRALYKGGMNTVIYATLAIK